MTRVAAIDCGTNSIRLLIADTHDTPAGPALTDVLRQMRVVRLARTWTPPANSRPRH